MLWRRGAVAFMDRPRGIGHPDHEATTKELVQTVKLMAEVKVVRRWVRLRKDATAGVASPPVVVSPEQAPAEIQVVAMGASTGGPLVLQTILSELPSDYSVPVLIVQHMAKGFIEGFVNWLAPTSALPIHVAKSGEQILPGHVYVAPDGLQKEVQLGGTLVLTEDESEDGHRPSVDYLFRSVSRIYGRKAVGVLLTGMGNDGAKGLKEMRENGAVTIAQNQESSVVHGMPGKAIRLDAATYVLPPNRIASALASLVNRKKCRPEHRHPQYHDG